MGTFPHLRKCIEKVNQEIYDAKVKREELKEQIEMTEVWLEELTRSQWELEKEIEESKKPKTVWDLEICDEYHWFSGTGEGSCISFKPIRRVPKGENKMSKRKIEDIKTELKKELDRLDCRKMRLRNHEEELEEAQHYVDHYARLTKEGEETVGRLRQELEEAKKPKTVWDLGDDDEYYWVSGAGEAMCDIWIGSSFEKARRDAGNVFLTKQEAKDEVRARKLIAKAKRSEGRKNFDSNELNELKWEIICIYASDISQSEVTVENYFRVSRANVFGSWETQEAAEKVLYENYEEFKWYFTEYDR